MILPAVIITSSPIRILPNNFLSEPIQQLSPRVGAFVSQPFPIFTQVCIPHHLPIRVLPFTTIVP